jgi:hypothetical protein
MGSQSCRFHPFAYYNRGANLLSCYSAENPTPTTCRTCSELYLRAPHGSLRPEQGGCIKIDHCGSIPELLAEPYFALPLEHLPQLALFRNLQSIVGKLPFPLMLQQMRMRCDVLVVSKPRHLNKRLVIGYPGTQRTFSKSIIDVYEQMAAQFALAPLYDEIVATRAADPLTRVSKQIEQNVDARRKDSLRLMTTRKVAFVQFIIVSKIQQGANGTVQMKLQN